MSRRWLGLAALALGIGGAVAPSAQAQIYYPYGYGNYGWGGWGLGNQYGSQAAGLGWMAAGKGVYNLDTAEARSINVQTHMQYNEYMYESLRQNQARMVAEHEKEYQDYKDASNAAQDRLRNHPTTRDIQSGEALNVALVELSDPRYAGEINKLANVPIDGRLIENIRFRNSVEVVSGTLDKLTSGTPTGLLAGPEFADDVKAYQAVCKEINDEISKSGSVKPATVGKLRDLLKAAYDKVEKMKPQDINLKIKAAHSLKAMLGMCYMFNDSQALDVYLAGVGEKKNIVLGELLSFMKSFNLTFGAAQNPAQNNAYAQVYQMLVDLRSKAFGEGTGTLPLDAPRKDADVSSVGKYYSGVAPSELNHENPRKNPPTPPAPGQ